MAEIFTKNGSKYFIRWDQENRIIEKFLKEDRENGRVTYHLESCNVCAACCAIDAIGASYIHLINEVKDELKISQADMMFNYIHQHLQDKTAEQANWYLDSLAFAIEKIAYTDTRIVSEPSITILQEAICNNKSIVQSYVTPYGAGHYICITGYDDETQEFIYFDSWKGNQDNKNSGKLERMSFDYYIKKRRSQTLLVGSGA